MFVLCVVCVVCVLFALFVFVLYGAKEKHTTNYAAGC